MIGWPQGWRCAPLPPAADGLDPIRSPVFLAWQALGRVPSAGVARSLTHRVATGIPFLAAGDHDVENDDQLAHAGDQGNLCLLALGDQATIEGLERRVVPGRSSQASHVEQIAGLAASPLDL